MRRASLVLVTLSIALLACSKPGPAPAKPASDKPAEPAVAIAGNSDLENRGVAMMQRMAAMFAADAADCEKLATDIKAFIIENRDLIDQLTALERTQSEQEKAAFEERNKPAQDAIVQKMEPAMTACAENPNVQAAMKQFPAE